MTKIVRAPSAGHHLAIANVNTLGSFFENVAKPMIGLRQDAAPPTISVCFALSY
jgi:hypothetical protein